MLTYAGEKWFQYKRAVADNYSSAEKEALLEFIYMLKSLSAQVCARQHTSAYVSIRQRTSACVLLEFIHMLKSLSAQVCLRQLTSAYGSMKKHTYSYVSIR
jgi:hypothetical protein